MDTILENAVDTLLIKNGRLLSPSTDTHADIFIRGERIEAIGADLWSLEKDADRVLDARDCYVLPGGIDQTQFEAKQKGRFSPDRFEDASLAAAYGGTTTLIESAFQTPGESLTAAFHQWLERAQGKSRVDFCFHLVVTDVNEKVLEEVPSLVEKGVGSFKIFMGFPGDWQLEDASILRLMDALRGSSAVLVGQTENGTLTEHLTEGLLKKGNRSLDFYADAHPCVAEIEAASRLSDYCEKSELSYSVALTCRESLERLRHAERKHVDTPLTHLMISPTRQVSQLVHPPLRSPEDQTFFWHALEDGKVQSVSSYHAPFDLEQPVQDFSKACASSMGVENRLELLHSEGVCRDRLSLQQWVAVTSTNLARNFGLFPQKGTLCIGSDADLVVFDPNRKHTIHQDNQHSKSQTHLFEGWNVTGKVLASILRGHLLLKDDKIILKQPVGKFIERHPDR